MFRKGMGSWGVRIVSVNCSWRRLHRTPSPGVSLTYKAKYPVHLEVFSYGRFLQPTIVITHATISMVCLIEKDQSSSFRISQTTLDFKAWSMFTSKTTCIAHRAPLPIFEYTLDIFREVALNKLPSHCWTTTPKNKILSSRNQSQKAPHQESYKRTLIICLRMQTKTTFGRCEHGNWTSPWTHLLFSSAKCL